MRITVRSPAGVFYQTEIATDLDAMLGGAESEHERRRTEEGLSALLLWEEGMSYGEIAKALAISKSSAWRRVENARQRYRAAVSAAGAEPGR